MTDYNGTTQIYESWSRRLAEASNLELDILKCLLTTSAYNVDLAAHETLSDIYAEVIGNGYERKTLQNVSFAQDGNISKFSSDEIIFTADGGSITARRYVIYNDTVIDKPLILTGLLRSDNNNIIITDGNEIVLTPPANGWFYTEIDNG